MADKGCICLILQEPIYFHGSLVRGQRIVTCDAPVVKGFDACKEHLTKKERLTAISEGVLNG